MCRAEAQHSSPGAGLARAGRKRPRGSCGAWGRWRPRPRRRQWLWRIGGTSVGDRAPQGSLEGPMEAAAGGGCGSGPPLVLSEGEQQCYSELFARCAGAASGAPGPGPPEAARVASGAATAAAGPVADLFRASQLPAETLHQVGLCSPCLCGPVGTVSMERLGRLGCPSDPGDAARSQRGALQLGMAATPLSPGDTSLLCSSAPRPVLGALPSSFPETV